MIEKETLRIGQRVWLGPEHIDAVVDGITRDWVALMLMDGSYVYCDFEDVYRKAEN